VTGIHPSGQFSDNESFTKRLLGGKYFLIVPTDAKRIWSDPKSRVSANS